MKKIVLIVSLVFVAFTLQAQKKKKNAKYTLEVDGVCMMCKKRIEKAALNTKGVKFANWNMKTHQLVVIFDERKTDTGLVSENLAKVGHDTKMIKATQEAYNSVHPCCRYREKKPIKNHEKTKKN